MTRTSASRWPAAFEEIRADFGYAMEADRRTADWLAAVLSHPPYAPKEVLDGLRAEATNRTVWVLGAADSALRDVRKVPPDEPLWVADGAATAALEAGRRPTALVSDLDGRLEDEIAVVQAGALAALHAHGDNLAALQAGLHRFHPSRVAGTCQVDAPNPLINPGGFTDGDRAVHLALAFGARQVRLVGFDYETGPGRYSGRFNPATKPKKLEWARRLIQRLIDEGRPVSYA